MIQSNSKKLFYKQLKTIIALKINSTNLKTEKTKKNVDVYLFAGAFIVSECAG